MPTKTHLVKAMVFPVVMYGCESWTVKKAECRRIDAFELWCWRRLLRVPWTARTSNQSILKETSPRCSLEGLMLRLKLQYFGHLMQRLDSLEKTLMLGGIGDTLFNQQQLNFSKSRLTDFERDKNQRYIDSLNTSLNISLVVWHSWLSCCCSQWPSSW